MEDALYPDNADEALYRANDAAYFPFTDSRTQHAHMSACDNAEDTSVQDYFDHHSPEWFACYASSYRVMLDTLPED